MTGLIGELFSSVQGIQLAGTKADVVRHFRQLSDRRRRFMVKNQLLTALLNSSFSNTVSIGTGLILILAALSIQSSNAALKVGDFALFVYYLSFITSFLSFLGSFLAMSKQTEVSFERMAELLEVKGSREQKIGDKGSEEAKELRTNPHLPIPSSPLISSFLLTAPHPLYLPDLLGRRPELPPLQQPRRHPQDFLQTLTATNLTYFYEILNGFYRRIRALARMLSYFNPSFQTLTEH
ncbi:ABC transporter ATP-binding protein [Pleurocapsales cyanobacterium LEGE 06147]|nr:ABC transporter ATP-binding protein [Pleurocapsales cyanobacterium LEGE 06147]